MLHQFEKLIIHYPNHNHNEQLAIILNNNNIGNKLTSEFTGPRSLPITPGIHIDHHLKGVKFIKNDAENGHQNKTSSQQAATPLSMNILRLGPRILWCELPQVRELGLLRKLTPGQRQLQEAMFEVITSEASYLSSLDILVNHFMHNIMYSETIFLDSRHKADIFSNICVIREVSGALMSIFEQRWKQNIVLSDICDILADYALSHFGPYVTYCRYKRRVKECNTAANQYDNYMDLVSRLKFTNIRGFSLNEPRWLILNVEVTRIKPETQSSILLGNFRAPHWSNSSNILSIMSDMVVLSKKKGI
ncbi:rho guanine nucleotide exchange factor 16-like [Brevipalpus obovatus]|uniref:rho guanine nucleotide exchange factor 16-like n=1 Tax=Brevipalpus obovatus TaxID=246614 RepID=UPI003D9F63A7